MKQAAGLPPKFRKRYVICSGSWAMKSEHYIPIKKAKRGATALCPYCWCRIFFPEGWYVEGVTGFARHQLQGKTIVE